MRTQLSTFKGRTSITVTLVALRLEAPPPLLRNSGPQWKDHLHETMTHSQWYVSSSSEHRRQTYYDACMGRPASLMGTLGALPRLLMK